MKIQKIWFENNKKQKLVGYVHVPKSYIHAYVHLHGFPGDCEGSAKRFCTQMAKRGFLSFRFNFHGSLDSQGDFSQKLMSQEVRDIRYAIDFLQKNYTFSKLILFGHSTGAIDASLYAFKDKRVTVLGISGGVSDLKKAVNYDFTSLQVKSFWEKGYIIYNRPGSWVYRKKLLKPFYDEFFTLNIQRALQKFNGKTMVVHGQKDSAVPVENAYEIYALVQKPKKLLVLPNADHKYTVTQVSIVCDSLVRFL